MSAYQDKPVAVTAATFDQEVVGSSIPVVVDFWAPWCGPCRAIGPVLEALSQQYAGQVKVVKVNVDDTADLAQAFQVRSIPTLVAMRGNEVVDVKVGFGGRADLEKLFERLASQTQKRAS